MSLEKEKYWNLNKRFYKYSLPHIVTKGTTIRQYILTAYWSIMSLAFEKKLEFFVEHLHFTTVLVLWSETGNETS